MTLNKILIALVSLGAIGYTFAQVEDGGITPPGKRPVSDFESTNAQPCMFTQCGIKHQSETFGAAKTAANQVMGNARSIGSVDASDSKDSVRMRGAAAPVPAPTPAPVSCSGAAPATTQTVGCPVGFIGIQNQSRTVSCDISSGAGLWISTGWINTTGNCTITAAPAPAPAPTKTLVNSYCQAGLPNYGNRLLFACDYYVKYSTVLRWSDGSTSTVSDPDPQYIYDLMVGDYVLVQPPATPNSLYCGIVMNTGSCNGD